MLVLAVVAVKVQEPFSVAKHLDSSAQGFKLPEKSHRCKSDLEDEEWEEELDPEELPEPFAPDFPEDE